MADAEAVVPVTDLNEIFLSTPDTKSMLTSFKMESRLIANTNGAIHGFV